MKTLRPLSAQDFGKLKSKNPNYYSGRWPYMKAAVEMAMSVNPSSAIELGPYQRPLLAGSDVMDKVDYTGGITFKWDATSFPWPIEDKKYDLFVALQVWEHLGDSQLRAFKEVARISRSAVLSFPYEWNLQDKNDCHHGIDSKKISAWTDGESGLVEKRIISTPDPRYSRMVCLYGFGCR